ncbi:elongation factor P-like protein YeiP [Vibrio campbellii]|jgi:elongation factor P|uniref:Elongation factor P-like protein n=1 Tax=Vibrio campbellii TaxID=680 RepID=A0AAE9SPW8_9VIBR|nr:elongation factor P-like protein YeiP [Vibrio campbellii]MED5505883.1 elongation factor P-like protein YeiP [Pseudomonadota bacterium]ARV72950.1 elongation factor P-like protein YeiP [Vibrio campbellii CAIM 519 = NBRC 15631 = ATCC 25920]AXB31817.1 elongation factor P-like protein YeiP [Vibrio campbellii]ELU52784.1 elongation factor P [Vibrio campbellii CAIM 519 = NBRC 15631 = ATCC 25920]RDX37621.1 elongation factor P-like protein YeiP [Vibrio campbellii]|tara:strand:+ start:268 stop:834 length:567 start_codon:yes stop_codon:yes gene_type:complete
MPKASEIKKGFAIESNGKTLLVKDIEVTTPGGRGGAKIYKMRCTDLNTGARVDERYKSDDVVETVEMNKRAVVYSYADGDEHIFMDNEDYSQYTFKHNEVEDELLFINEDTQGIHIILINGSAVGIELPSSVELVIEETDPSIKGASASARTKPARFASGLVIQVPEYIATGDRVIINTTERKYMSRA